MLSFKKKRAFVYLASSFSKNFGGRTAATFKRAILLSDQTNDSYIFTANYKVDYGDILRDIQKERNIPENIKHLNLYEY